MRNCKYLLMLLMRVKSKGFLERGGLTVIPHFQCIRVMSKGLGGASQVKRFFGGGGVTVIPRFQCRFRDSILF